MKNPAQSLRRRNVPARPRTPAADVSPAEHPAPVAGNEEKPSSPVVEETSPAEEKAAAEPVVAENSLPQPAPARKTVRKKTAKPAAAGDSLPLPGTAADDALLKDMQEHGEHVAAMAAVLFDSLQELHGLAPLWRERLLLAARYHDLGWIEGRKGHHKTSMRMILADQKLDIRKEDRPFVALLARYHRKAWPATKHAPFAALSPEDREAVRRCAALLRVADGLDYTHARAVQKLEVICKKRRVLLVGTSESSCAEEAARALRKGDLFMYCFKKDLSWRHA